MKYELRSSRTAGAFALWLTGLPASGKTTLAREMQKQFNEQNVHTVILDSDELRAVLTPEPVYTAAERDWFYQVIAHLAAWLVENKINVLIAATANERRYRDQARQRIKRFAEVYVHCPLAVCQARDPKGVYRRASEGTAENVPGVDAAYQPPLSPEAAVDTAQYEAAAAASYVIAQLSAKGILL